MNHEAILSLLFLNIETVQGTSLLMVMIEHVHHPVLISCRVIIFVGGTAYSTIITALTAQCKVTRDQILVYL